jgi:hypothetical protein
MADDNTALPCANIELWTQIADSLVDINWLEEFILSFCHTSLLFGNLGKQ